MCVQQTERTWKGNDGAQAAMRQVHIIVLYILFIYYFRNEFYSLFLFIWLIYVNNKGENKTGGKNFYL